MPNADDMAIVVCLRSAADREVAAHVLQKAGLEHRLVSQFDDLLSEARSGAGVLLLEESLLTDERSKSVNDILIAQPGWSDMPVVLLTSRARPEARTHLIRNVTLIERPIPAASLVSVLRLAMQARRRQYEARDLVETLQSRVEQRTIELQRSNTDLEQFAYVASHDLREPLRMITGFMGLLKERYSPQLDDKARQYIDLAADGAQRMDKLLNGLLEYSRVSTGAFKVEAVPMREVFDKVAADLRRKVDESGGQVTADDLPVILANRTQMAQLLQNLISNAIKFCRQGVPPRVHVSARKQEDGRWQFSVQDNGIGMDTHHEQSGRIFTVFQRLHTRDEYEGSGIGLAICKKIVERHGGTIWVESTPGQGTTFYFTLSDTTEA